MKKYCLLLSVMLLCFLCACSVTEQNERTTMYDIMESGTDEEIAAAAKDAQEKHDELFQLAMGTGRNGGLLCVGRIFCG